MYHLNKVVYTPGFRSDLHNKISSFDMLRMDFIHIEVVQVIESRYYRYICRPWGIEDIDTNFV